MNPLYKEPLLLRPRLFAAACILFLLAMLLASTYPHSLPLGDRLLAAWGLPRGSRGDQGVLYTGVTATLLSFTGLFMLRYSLARHSRGAVLLALILLPTLPKLIIFGYQSLFAQGIYALDYKPQFSSCQYKSEEPGWISGTCTLSFRNHSREPVEIQVGLRPTPGYPTDIPSPAGSLGSIQVRPGGETTTRELPFRTRANGVDPSFSASSSSFSITITDGQHTRQL